MGSRAACLVLLGALLLSGCDLLPRDAGSEPTRDGEEGEVERAALEFILFEDSICETAATPNALAQLFGTDPSGAPAACRTVRDLGSGEGNGDGEVDEVEISGRRATVSATAEGGQTWPGQLELTLLRDGGAWRVERITAVDLDYRAAFEEFGRGVDDGAIEDCLTNVGAGRFPEAEFEQAILDGTAFRALLSLGVLCGARIQADNDPTTEELPQDVLDCAILSGLSRIPTAELIEASGSGEVRPEREAAFAREAVRCSQGGASTGLGLDSMPRPDLPPIGAERAPSRRTTPDSPHGGSASPAARGAPGNAPPSGASGAPSVPRYLDCVAAHADEIKRCARRFL